MTANHRMLTLSRGGGTTSPLPQEPAKSGNARGRVIRDEYPPPGVVVLRAIGENGEFVEARMIRVERYTEDIDEELFQVLDEWTLLQTNHRPAPEGNPRRVD